MEKISFGPDREASEVSMRRKILRGKQVAVKLEEHQARLEEFRLLCAKNEAGTALTADEREKFKFLDDFLDDSEIVVSSIVEYKRLLELLGISKERVYKILNHENAHGNMSQQMPSQKFFGFKVLFYLDEDGELNILPSAYHKEDKSFSEIQRLEESIKTKEAPLHYGSELSSSDIADIEHAKKRLTEIKNSSDESS
ncbi:MAG: hypothetical protein KBD55_00435 [Candidatus Pacebacteria bacterium]|jgi:hypothetical protein|nr:hypothetical protein [Candidatus Paceibacterota bacterium]